MLSFDKKVQPHQQYPFEESPPLTGERYCRENRILSTLCIETRPRPNKKDEIYYYKIQQKSIKFKSQF